MSVRIISGVRSPGGEPPSAALYDSTTGFAFGPTFAGTEEAESFLRACAGDPRQMSHRQLVSVHAQWARWWASQEGIIELPDEPKFAPPASIPGGAA